MHLSRLGLWYGTFTGQNRGRPPTTIKQLKEYGQQSLSPERLAARHATSIDELFVSPRDGLPYKMVNYSRLPAFSEDPVVVFYEQKGQDGIRRVALLGGGSLAFDEERLRKLVPTFRP